MLVLLAVGGTPFTVGADRPATDFNTAFNAMREAFEARDLKAVLRRVTPDFVLTGADGATLNRRQYEAAWKRTLDSLTDLQVRFSNPLPLVKRREAVVTTDFQFDGHAQPAPLPLTVTRLESGATRTVFANPQNQRYLVYVGSLQQTWALTRQGWQLKRQTILREKMTVDPRPFTLPMQPGGAGDREVETLTPVSPLLEIEPLFDFRAPLSRHLPGRG